MVIDVDSAIKNLLCRQNIQIRARLVSRMRDPPLTAIHPGLPYTDQCGAAAGAACVSRELTARAPPTPAPTDIRAVLEAS